MTLHDEFCARLYVQVTLYDMHISKLVLKLMHISLNVRSSLIICLYVNIGNADTF